MINAHIDINAYYSHKCIGIHVHISIHARIGILCLHVRLYGHLLYRHTIYANRHFAYIGINVNISMNAPIGIYAHIGMYAHMGI